MYSGRSGPDTPRGVSAFTLFEVLISMLVMSVAVLAVAGILPSGIQAQEQARYQIYASAIALEIAHRQASDSTTQYGRGYAENEAYGSGNNQNRSMFNAVLANPMELSFRNLKPLPSAIAARIDSDNDEIAAILASGGQIYYADGSMLMAEERDKSYEQDGESVGYKMLVGVLGEPQNGLIRHPEIAWPYRDALLAPPVKQVDSWYDPDVERAFGSGNRYATSPGVRDNSTPSIITITDDTDYAGDRIAHHSFSIGSGSGDGWHTADYLTLGAFDFWRQENGAPRPNADDELLEAEIALTGLAAAWHYASLKSIDPLTGAPTDVDDTSYVPTADEVRVFRFAAYFARRLTSALFSHGEDYYQVFDSTGKVRIDLEDATDSLTVDMWKQGDPWTESVTLDRAAIDLLHEKAIRVAMNFQARFPYRWDVTRPIERSVAWDVPLLQYDVMPDTGHPYVGAAPRWPVISPVRMQSPVSPANAVTDAQALAAYGRSHTSDNLAEITRSWAAGNGAVPDRFTATREWEAADRCRQLVFWLADWQSYQDFEEQPPEDMDSSRYTFTSDGELMNIDEFPFLMPEGGAFWSDASRSDTVNWKKVVDDNRNWRTSLPGLGTLEAFWGQYGADRNGNQRFDRGALPPTTRIRATTIARFNIYESIGTGSITN